MLMNNYFILPTDQKRLVLQQVSDKVSLPIQAIEKDIWVSTILQLIFSLPIAEWLIFKGGTSLSKVWGVIQRFSEDIDLALDRKCFGYEGDLTKKQLKVLRKKSSVFVRDELANQLSMVIHQRGLSNQCSVMAEADGEGDATYPEPRKLMVYYESVIPNPISYLRPMIQLEIGARSLFEPFQKCPVNSIVEQQFPNIQTSLLDMQVATSIPEKTFLEKVFLLHELFSVNRVMTNASRKSRHLYDLDAMMRSGIAERAIHNIELWETIRHHRQLFTSVNGVSYDADMRKQLILCPPADSVAIWREDYQDMCNTMIYGVKPTFDELIAQVHALEQQFRDS